MWAFRRWMLSNRYTIDEYIKIQTSFILTLMSNRQGPSLNETISEREGK
jgi:hypothetical protein